MKILSNISLWRLKRYRTKISTMEVKGIPRIGLIDKIIRLQHQSTVIIGNGTMQPGFYVPLSLYLQCKLVRILISIIIYIE